jgi:hypothetical protein
VAATSCRRINDDIVVVAFRRRGFRGEKLSK